MPQSPHTKGIIQHFTRQVQLHTEGLDQDLQVTNNKIGQLEATQLATTTKLIGLEASVARMDRSLAALLKHFNDFHTKDKEQHKTRTKSDSKIIMMMIILLILNMMLMTLMTGVAYAIIVEVWVVTADVRYPIIMMLLVR